MDFNGAKLRYFAFAPLYLLFTWLINPLTIVTTFIPAVRAVAGQGSGKWISPKRKAMTDD